jgi:aryl-alcohol dehydrogenase-like predicted oxidoreductase
MSGFFGERLRSDRTLTAVQQLRPIAEGLSLTLAQLALSWVLRLPGVSSAIVGATHPGQLDDNAAASGVRLNQETLDAIDRVTLPLLRDLEGTE